MGQKPGQPESAALVLFDGDCGLCNRSVRFIAERDPSGRFLFAPLQSELAQTLLALHGRARTVLDTLVLLEDEHAYTRSTAALRIARHLRWPWPLLYALIVVPRWLRDAVYAWVAARRYRWFGRSDACPLPSPSLRSRLLDGHLPPDQSHAHPGKDRTL